MTEPERCYSALVALPLGDEFLLGIRMSGNAVKAIELVPRDQPTELYTSYAAQAVVQFIQGYFNGDRASPEFAIEPDGSPFQQRVWRMLGEIPYAQTRSYGQLANMMRSAPRPVASACRANPIPLLIPCHRVIAQSGIGGYMGDIGGGRVKIKQWLLEHEGAI